MFATKQSAYAALFNKANYHFKKALFTKLQLGLQNVDGDVLEIPIGSGANLEFFPREASLIAMDYNPHMEKNTQKKPGQVSSCSFEEVSGWKRAGWCQDQR